MEETIGADSRWGREREWLGLRQEMPEDPTKSAREVGRAAAASETSRAKGEQRDSDVQKEKKNSFLVEPKFFVFSKPKGLLMWKGIFELLEDALGMENGLRSLWIWGNSLNGGVWRPFFKAQWLVPRTG